MFTKYVFLWSMVTLALAQEKPEVAVPPEKPSATVEQEKPPDILFKIPDIQTTYRLENDDEVTLVAYKTHETNDLINLAQKDNRSLTESEARRINWMTAGICSFVPNRIFYQPTHIEMGLNCLNDHIRAHLARKASEKHRLNVTSDRIHLLPFSLVKCRANVFDSRSEVEVRLFGEVKTFKRSPLTLEINARENSKERNTFELLQSEKKTMAFDCELFASGKTQSKNELTINFKEKSMADMVDRVLGGAESSFVTRDQVSQFSQEVYTALDIEESYEMPETAFSDNFVNNFLNLAATQAFHEESIDKALAQLSKYSVDFSEDLKPDVITKEMSDIFSVNDTGSEVKVTIEEEAYKKFQSKYGSAFSNASSDSSSGSLKTSHSHSGSVGVSILKFGGEAKFSTKGSRESSNAQSNSRASSGSENKESDNTTNTYQLNDQLQRMSSHMLSQVRFQFEGNRIVPKSLSVVKLLRANINREMKFSRIRKSLHKAPFHEIVRVVLNDVTMEKENNLFKIPDIQTIYKLENGDEATLDAYRTNETNELISLAQRDNRSLTESEASRVNWMTAGFCIFESNRIFYRPTHIEIGISCLNDYIRAHLAKKASEKHGINVKSDQIHLIPFSQFKCRAIIFDPITGAEVRFFGKVENFKTSPLKLEINAPGNSAKRVTFQSLQSVNAIIEFDCELFAYGKTESKKELKIDFRDKSMVGMVRRFLGNATKSFFTHQQVAQFAQEVYTKLNIEEEYEMSESTFLKIFVEDFIKLAAKEGFHEMSVNRTLAKLSKYSIDFAADFKPKVVVHDIKSIFSINDTSIEIKVSLNPDAYKEFKSKYGHMFSDVISANSLESQCKDKVVNASFSVQMWLFGGASDGASGRAASPSTSSRLPRVTNNYELNKQLQHISSRIVSQIHFEFDNRLLVPKTLWVAKLLPANIKNEMKFDRIRKTLHTAPFHETVRLVLNDETLSNLPLSVSLHLISKLNTSMTALKAEAVNTKKDLNTFQTTITKEIQTETGKINSALDKTMGKIVATRNAFDTFHSTIYNYIHREIKNAVDETHTFLNKKIETEAVRTNNSLASFNTMIAENIQTETKKMYIALNTMHTSLAKKMEKNQIPVGTIIIWTNTSIPPGWLRCNGQILSKTDYPLLFAAIDYRYGGNHNGTFKVPNLVDRFPVGYVDTYFLGKEFSNRKSYRASHATISAIRDPHAKASKGPYCCGYSQSASCTCELPPDDMPPYILVNFLIKYD